MIAVCALWRSPPGAEGGDREDSRRGRRSYEPALPYGRLGAGGGIRRGESCGGSLSIPDLYHCFPGREDFQNGGQIRG